MKRHAKRIIYDIVGLMLIIISPFLGWIPGPGGIPVFLAGLALLAVHNDWAKNLLTWAKSHSEHLLESLFPANRRIELAHDIFGIVLIGLAIGVFFIFSKPFKFAIPVMLLSMSLFWLLYNKRRFKKIINKQ